MLSGITMTALYPRAAAVIAIPTPVLPLVGSIIVPPGLSLPLFSASMTMLYPTLSLMLPAGLNISTFATISAPAPKRSSILWSLSSGVFPISCVTVSLISIFLLLTRKSEIRISLLPERPRPPCKVCIRGPDPGSTCKSSSSHNLRSSFP